MAFHWKDNWFFERLETGDVKLTHVTTDVTAPSKPYVDVDIEIDPDSWASIVASVSKLGETGRTFAIAKALHNGKVARI